MQQPKRTPSFAGQFLKDYRIHNKLTQEQLAYELNIEPRTLRAYENGERQLNNVKELQRIADILGIEPELLGVMPAIYVPKRPEEIDIIVNRVWSLLDEPRVITARNIIEKLISDITPQITTENPILLRSLARAYHAAGYVTGLSTRTSEIAVPLHHYQQLEEIARLINDDTLLNIALTYQGDMVRRHGDVIKAIVYLEAARDYYSDT